MIQLNKLDSKNLSCYKQNEKANYLMIVDMMIYKSTNTNYSYYLK